MRRSQNLYRLPIVFVVVVLALGTWSPVTRPTAAAQSSASAVTIDTVNLRWRPGADQPVLDVVPAGVPFVLEGGAVNGFYPVTYGGQFGWIFGVYLALDGVQTATVTEDLLLRVDPAWETEAMLVMPPGTEVTLTGGSVDDFVSVAYAGLDGWVTAAYLSIGGGGTNGGEPARTAVTSDAVNLRTGPSLDTEILQIVPWGAAVETTGAAQNGYYPARYGGQSGWLSGDYLDFSGGGNGGGGGGGGGAGLIAWPFEDGAEWWITQGYNGPWSHWNSSPRYQYRYSLDLRRVEGWSAGQAVLSPVTGTIRWIDRASGGMSIDLGNGYAVSYFHTYLAGGLAAGQRVTQGQYMGTIAEPGDARNGGISHLHLSLWRTNDGGNEDRQAVPFTGAYAIEGVDLPDVGGIDQHWGETFWS